MVFLVNQVGYHVSFKNKIENEKKKKIKNKKK